MDSVDPWKDDDSRGGDVLMEHRKQHYPEASWKPITDLCFFVPAYTAFK